jgi:DNA-binding SARP family transcriptional activator/tetratricopeptide (TPR) repeat protein
MRPAMRLCLLGPFTVEGELSAPLPTGKARLALAALAERRGEFVTVHALIDALWEGDPPERADRNVAALVSRLRKALGRDLIDGSAVGYRLSPQVDVDLHEACELVGTAEFELAHGHPALASTSGEQAAKLLDADTPMGDERDGEWVRALREHVRTQLRRARIAWSAAALQLGAYDTAVQVGSAAMQADPFDEDACRTVMLAHQQAGRSGAALLAYRALRETLVRHLGIDPSPATQALHLAVLRSEQNVAPDPSSATSPTTGPMVGRDVELARLQEMWAAAVAGTPALAVVTGEAGIGKSALVAAFVEEPLRTGALVVQVACYEAERSLYLQPLVEAVRAVVQRMTARDVRELAATRLGTLTELLPELADVVGPVEYERAGPEVEHRRSLDAVAEFVARVGARRPLLLVVEDMQHAGQSTVEALHVLAGHGAGSRWMVVLTERTSEDADVTGPLLDVGSRLQLGPLSAGEVAMLVERSGLAHDPDRIWSWTGGSPLFLTEVLRHPEPGTDGSRPVIPHSLHDAVAARIEHAGQAVARLLSQGAVLGTTFSLDDVAALSNVDVEDAATQAGRAIRAGLLMAHGDSFRFANDIVRQVAYASVPEPVRISRHRRAARLFDSRPEAAAQHLAAAGDARGAADAWLAAAEAAHVSFAHTDAERLLDLAVEYSTRGGDGVQTVGAYLRRGQVRCDLGRHASAREDHEHALGLARELGDLALEACALEQLGWTALYARDALVAVDLAEQATQLAESAAAAPGALPSATLLLGRVRHWDGDYSGAETAYDQVLASAPADTTTALALAYRGALLQHQDRFAEAQSVLARAAVLCRRTGEFRPLLQTLFFTALARGDIGDFAGALRALDNARRLVDAENLGFYRAGIETTTSWMWQELGQVDRAREHAVRAVELAHRGGGALELEQELHALLAVADCDLMQGRPDDAAVAVETATPMLERSLPFRPRAAMRLLEMRARWDASEAEHLLIEARRYSSPKYEALALAHLGRPQEAAGIASATRSDLLLAQLGAPAEQSAARDRIAAALPAELRHTFAASGRLSTPGTATR